MQGIDVDEIMREVRADIDKRDIKENPIRFREAYEDELPFVWPQNFEQKILHDETMNAMALWDTSVEPLDNAVGLKRESKKTAEPDGNLFYENTYGKSKCFQHFRNQCLNAG